MTPVPSPRPPDAPVDLHAAHRSARSLLADYQQADQALLLLRHHLLSQRLSTALLVDSAGIPLDLAQHQVGQVEDALTQAIGRAQAARLACERATAPLLGALAPEGDSEPLGPLTRGLLGTLETVRRMLLRAAAAQTKDVCQRWIGQALRDLDAEMADQVRTADLAADLDDEATARLRSAVAYCEGD